MKKRGINTEQDKLFDVFYTDAKGNMHSVRYCCKNEDEARRLFFSESKKGETIHRVDEILD